MEIPMKTLKTARIDKLAFVFVTSVLLWTGALPAQADPGNGARAKQVSLADLDLSTIQGQETARERLHQMARHLCARVEDDLDLSKQTNYVRCVDQATALTSSHLNAMIRRASDIRTASVGQAQP
jgi:UrcA family protein